MKKVVQQNRQTTVVKVKTTCSGCRSKKRKRRRRRGGRARFIHAGSGIIFQKCDSTEQLYFQTVEAPPCAAVQIRNDTDTLMTATLQRGKRQPITQTIGQSQQVNVIVPRLTRLLISCSGRQTAACRGCYAIRFGNERLRSSMLRMTSE